MGCEMRVLTGWQEIFRSRSKSQHFPLFVKLFRKIFYKRQQKIFFPCLQTSSRFFITVPLSLNFSHVQMNLSKVGKKSAVAQLEVTLLFDQRNERPGKKRAWQHCLNETNSTINTNLCTRDFLLETSLRSECMS